MTDVSFYILTTNQERQRYVVACRVAEKAYKLGQQVFILTRSEDQTLVVDKLLWSFRQGSFVPHLTQDVQPTTQQLPNSVIIGSNPQENAATVLINLSEQLPEPMTTVQRIVEIVDQDEQIKQAGRQRYKAYQSQNIPLTVHEL